MTGKPAAAGFYQRRYQDETGDEWLTDYWDGNTWYFTKEGAPCITQDREWRVITKEEGK